MREEFITIRAKETTARVQNSELSAIRIKDIVKKGVRVYRDGKIGISGAVGDVADSVLLENAMQNLDTGIDYPFALSGNLKDYRDYNQTPMGPEALLAHSEDILKTLATDYPDFRFSESICIHEITQQMRNSEGLDLEYRDSYMQLGLILKEKQSANLFDGFLLYQGRSFDRDKFWNFNRAFLEAYRNKVDLPLGDTLPVFFLGIQTLNAFLSRALNGERYATGSSIFANRMGDQLFNSKVTLEQNRNPEQSFEPFFDMEGVVLIGDRYPLISDGKLVSVLTDKRNSALYNLPHTGAASGAYDDMPSLTATPLAFATDSTDIKQALGGKMGILVLVSAGGDFTPDGSFAAPVQVSFLFDGERIIGKLPEFSIRSHLYKVLGDDYIGTFENMHLYIGDGRKLQGYQMSIVR
jgi:PmbA protein